MAPVIDGALALIEIYPVDALAATAPVQLTPLVEALAIFDKSAIAKYGFGSVLVTRAAALTSVVAVSSLAPWKVIEPLEAETFLAFE